jgi:hypothetical protein
VAPLNQSAPLAIYVHAARSIPSKKILTKRDIFRTFISLYGTYVKHFPAPINALGIISPIARMAASLKTQKDILDFESSRPYS